MACTTYMSNLNNYNNIPTFSNMRPRPHSFGQVSLTNKIEFSNSSARQSVVFSAPVASQAAAVESRSSALLAAVRTVSTLRHLWRQIQGSNNWEDLLEPLHPLLRHEIIRYGEFVVACYKAFDLDPNSKRYLNCKFGKKSLLREVGMENSGYNVTKYIYATPDVNIPIQNAASCGRWIGYVAVSSDNSVNRLGRRDVLITFRGTVTNPEWMANLMSSLTPARLDPHNPRPNVKVESGFLSLYTSDESSSKFGLDSCRQQLLSEISRLLSVYEGEELSITLAGHSMGSALALLLAYDITELGLNKQNSSRHVPVTVFSFGGPRVGNSEFKQRCDELGVKVLRIANMNDPVTKLPGILMNENFKLWGGKIEFPWSCSCYAHVGVELVLDFFNMQNPSCVHDLQSYINLLKRPKQVEDHQGKNDDESSQDFLRRAVEFLSNSAQNLNTAFSGRNATSNMVNLIDLSQRT